MFKNKFKNRVSMYLLCILYTAVALATTIISCNSFISALAEVEENYTIDIEADYETAYDLYEAQALYNVELAQEGIVLMDNKEDENGDTLLPMGVNTTGEHQISIFGKHSASYEYHPEGADDSSSRSLLANQSTSTGNAIDEEVTFYDAFRGEDTEATTTAGAAISGMYTYPSELMSQSFSINETLVDFYEDDEASPVTQWVAGSGGGHFSSYTGGMPICETPVSYYTDTVKDSYAEYDDAAIVVLTRLSGEGTDQPKTSLGWEQTDTDGNTYWDGSWTGKYLTDYSDANKMEGARYWDDHYLQLGEDEVAMLQMVMLNFTDIIIIANTNAQFELGFMDDPGHYLYSDNDFANQLSAQGLTVEDAMARLRASLYMGYTGTFGAVALAQIIDGSVNPSAKTTNLWQRDFKLDPTWQNSGLGEIAGGASTNNNNKFNSTSTWATQWSNSFAHYDEDIYLGYRYYETRAVEDGLPTGDTFTTSGNTSRDGYNESTDYAAGWENGYISIADSVADYKSNAGALNVQSQTTTTTEWDSWYDSQVLYPFGYGISYTEFEWSDITIATTGNKLQETGEVTATVTVTNTGDYAGKEVVQLYYSAPYYDGQVQKSHVDLGGFEKTSLLDPGESQTLTITMPVEYMKSYDWNDANGNSIEGYEMDKGDYYITLATDSHDAGNKVRDKDTTTTQVFTVEESIYFQYDLHTGTEVVNAFDYSSGEDFTNEVDSSDDFKGVMQYMMRDDFVGTYPTHTQEKLALYGSVSLTQTKADETVSAERDLESPWYYEGTYENQATVAGTSYTNEIKLWHLTGRDYDDPLWESFLDQLTIEEMATLFGTCNYATAGIESIDKPAVQDQDGSLGANNCVSIQWPGNTIVAQTFNKELTYMQGRLYATSAMFPQSGRSLGGTYGTGLETLRSPFAGRCSGYYSEDPVLGGIMCAPYMQGANDTGVYITVKHFGLNNLDTARGNISTWASESAIRQIYTKAYEIVIKEGYTVALMSATNYVGDQSASTCYPLLTTLLRDEWGFTGFILSDMTARNPEMSMRAGQDLQLQGDPNIPDLTVGDYNTTVHAVRSAFKNLMYVYANSHIMNGYGGDSLDNYTYTGAQKLYTIQNVASGYDLSADTIQMAYSGSDFNDVKFTLSSGTVPAGMTLNSDGTLTGTATTVGSYTFKAKISEDIPPANVMSDDQTSSNVLGTVAFSYEPIEVEFTMTVISENAIPEDIVYPTQKLSDGAKGYSYTQNIASAIYYDDKVQTNDISYALASYSSLPSGLSLDGGIISGIITANAGTYTFDIIATANDSDSGKDPITATMILEVKEYGVTYDPVDISGLDYSVGDSINFSVSGATTNSGGAVSYSLATGSSLPKGLSLSNTGTISGTAQEGCTDYEFTVVASSPNSASASVTYKMTIGGIVCYDQTYDDLIYDKEYIFKIESSVNTDEDAVVTFALKDGYDLPVGFELYTDGTLAGTAYDLGTVSFVVIVSADGQQSIETTITLVITDMEFSESTSSPDDSIDFDALNAESETGGCSSSVNVFDATLVFLALLASGVFVMLNAKKRKSNK